MKYLLYGYLGYYFYCEYQKRQIEPRMPIKQFKNNQFDSGGAKTVKHKFHGTESSVR